jgi:hypothetical protein
MRSSVVIVAMASLVAVAAKPAAAQKTSFAGTWAVVADPNAPPPGRGGGGGLGQGATITQDDKQIIVARTTQAGEVKTVYMLDGSDSKNTMSFGGNSVDQISKLKWDGPKLTITTTVNFNGNERVTTQNWWMDGGNLVIETTAPGRGGGAPMTTKMTYKKN